MSVDAKPARLASKPILSRKRQECEKNTDLGRLAPPARPVELSKDPTLHIRTSKQSHSLALRISHDHGPLAQVLENVVDDNLEGVVCCVGRDAGEGTTGGTDVRARSEEGRVGAFRIVEVLKARGVMESDLRTDCCLVG